jgi:HD-GYP domain-containing protein (c-di-GMP phosphodiesterase class II)
MTTAPNDAPDHRWRARPVLAGTLRCVLLAVPLVASSATMLLVSRLLPAGAGSTWWGLTALLVTAVAVAVVVERAARRLLPIALLLKLSMIFPDRAPSRLKLVRSAAGRPPSNELLWSSTDAEPTSTADLVLRLVAALGTHDRRTRGHSERVRLLCDMLGEELKLDQDARDRLRWSALLHDVGKMKVSTAILNKPGRLDAREFDRIKGHPAAGAELAAPLLPWLGEWGDGILDHHEKYDGSGYPHGKAGVEISAAGRLIGLIDAFETMTAARPYKKAMATRAAREELARCAGSHFDPVFVRAFLAISLPRVLWAMGPLSFLFQLPFLRPLADAGARAGVVAPQAAASALTSGAAGAAVIVGGLGGAGGQTTGLAEMLEDRALAAAPQSAPDLIRRQFGGPTVERDERSLEPLPAQLEAALQAPREPDRRVPMPGATTRADEPVAARDRTTSSRGSVDPAPTESSMSRPAAPLAPARSGEDVSPEVEQTPAAEPTPSTPEPAPSTEAPSTPPEEPTEDPTQEPTEPAEPTAEPTPAEEEPEEPTAEPTPAEEEPEDEPTAHPAVLSGPPAMTSSREATFEFVPDTSWECQLLANGSGSSSRPVPCSGTYVVTVNGDGDYVMKIKNAKTGEAVDPWMWTVDSTLASARALTGLMLLDDVSDEQTDELASPYRRTLASPYRRTADPALPLLALLMALGLPFAAAARWLRARRP